MIANTKGTKVISDCLNTAIRTVKIAIKPLGIRAISMPAFGSRVLKRIYAKENPTIMIKSCLILKPRNIGSSFSICTGILYCIFFSFLGQKPHTIFSSKEEWSCRETNIDVLYQIFGFLGVGNTKTDWQDFQKYFYIAKALWISPEGFLAALAPHLFFLYWNDYKQSFFCFSNLAL